MYPLELPRRPVNYKKNRQRRRETRKLQEATVASRRSAAVFLSLRVLPLKDEAVSPVEVGRERSPRRPDQSGLLAMTEELGG